MKLSTVAKMALMNCETVMEAKQVLVMYSEDVNSTLRSGAPPAKDGNTQELKERLYKTTRAYERLKERYDKAMGAPQPGKRDKMDAPKDVDAASVSSKAVKDLIRAWHTQGKGFTSLDIARYFNIGPQRASWKLSGLWRKNSRSYWAWFYNNFEKDRAHRPNVYRPKTNNPKEHVRGPRVIAQGTPGGTAVVHKRIEPSD